MHKVDAMKLITVVGGFPFWFLLEAVASGQHSKRRQQCTWTTVFYLILIPQ
jgi:hypothetical protein